MKNKNIVIYTLIILLIVILGIVIGVYVFNDTKKMEVEVKNKSFDEHSDETYDAVYVNGKLVISEADLLKMSVYIELDELEEISNDGLIVSYKEFVESSSSLYFLIYDKGESYINLENISEFKNIKDVEVNDKKIRITSELPYAFVDVLCMEHSESEVINVTEEFEYLGKGKFSSSKVVSEKTVLDIIKEKGYTTCDSFN